MIGPGTLRFILAATVVFFHITRYAFLGGFAVHAFFMLSGYWISVMYQTKYVHAAQPLKIYFISRLWRLLPVFYLFSLAVLPVYGYFDPGLLESLEIKKHLFSHLTLLGYYQVPFLLPPAWSLDIEVQFYLVFPLLFLLFRHPSYLKITGVASLLVWAFLFFWFPAGFLSHTILYFLPYFLAGMLLYKTDLRFSPFVRKASLVLVLGIILMQYLIPALRSMALNGDKNSTYLLQLNGWLPFVAIPFIESCLRKKSSGFDRMLGDMSYVLYLCHWLLLIPYAKYVAHMGQVERLPFTAIYLATTLAASYLIYRYYDLPIDRWRRRWVERTLAKESNPIGK